MQRKLLFIVNPISGTRNKKNLREIIEQETRKIGFPFSIYPSVSNGDYSFLYPVIKDERFTDVIIAGGDGTINQAVNSLRKQNVQFGIIPCGSGNGLAFSAGIPKDPVKALQIAFNGKSKLTDGFTINKRFACMLVGLGFDAQVAHDFADAPKRGLTTYVKKTLQNFFTSTAYSFVINTAEKEIKTEAFFISVANSNQFGNNFTIAPKASLTDGLLDVVIMTKQNKLSVLFQTLKQISGFNKVQRVDIVDERSSLIYFQTESLHITNLDEAPMHIDGDPVETVKELEFKVKHDCFRLLQ
ncbi:diacylglycerol/lipid kinase family protein [Flavisolibacter ginsenosidimutans]|uniref:YegS/Rv2252/BmrU family lipid kinase n=1 Tax=Flavisolibacter ginsenosidimutans TaxID=661481 RepID=A0A5B8ULE0_9BACT|nr:YegS/Rv2252/BmrU family lipid kinase [Flavisolibacter ginsenosidimutans]QEC57256.1 YegS/Rv2252/BmrU family lipid kinase [Flavisolibacter ginsenosidimutans]